MQNVHRGICCVARSIVLLEPHVVYVYIVQFGPKEICFHRSVALVVDGDDLNKVVLKKVRTSDDASPKSAANNNFL